MPEHQTPLITTIAAGLMLAEAGAVVQQARAANPTLDILARAHSNAAVDHLRGLGANLVVLGEQEIAHRMLERARAEINPG